MSEQPGRDPQDVVDEVTPPRDDLWTVSLNRQRRSWAIFVAVVGLALLGLCALDYSQVALVLGAVLLAAGVVTALIPQRP